jgi:tetratricopeptide (TPR) repeat protein
MGFGQASAAIDLLDPGSPHRTETWVRRDETSVPLVGNVVSAGLEADLVQFKADLRQGNLRRIGLLGPVLLQNHPNDPELNGYVAVFRAVNGAAAEARKSAQAAERTAGGRGLSRWAESVLRRRSGDASGALASAREAIEIDPRHPWGWNVLGLALWDVGDRVEALVAFRKTWELEEGFLPGRLNAGGLSLESGNHAEARVYFGKAAAQHLECVEARYGLALAGEGLGDLPAAIRELEAGLGLRRDDPILLPRLVELQIRSGNLDDARTGALRMDSLGISGAGIRLADVLLRSGKYAEAEKQLGKVSDRESARFFLEGFRWLALGRLTETQESFEHKLRLEPGHGGTRLALEVLRLARGEPGSKDWETMAERPDETGRAFAFVRACRELSLTNYAAAHGHFMAATEFLPGFAMTGADRGTLEKALPPAVAGDLALGVLLYAKGMSEAARSALDRVRAADGGCFLAEYWLGRVALGEKDFSRAGTHFERCLQVVPTFRAGLIAAADGASRQGRFEVAAGYLRRALVVEQNSALAQRLAEVLAKTRPGNSSR